MIQVTKKSYDAYPCLVGPLASDFSSAVIHIYEQGGEGLVSRYNFEEALKSDGWIISSLINSAQCEEITDEKISREIDEFGVFIQIDRVRRERIFLHDDLASDNCPNPSAEISKFISHVQDDKASIYSLFSRDHDQFANGISPNGEEFLPLWVSESSAKQWDYYYPGYLPRAISLEEYRKEILPQLISATIMVAVGMNPEHLLTVHPRAICG